MCILEWSFDDRHIGLKGKDAPALSDRRLPRPPNMRLSDWYNHAAAVCVQLNGQRSIVVRSGKD